MGYYIYLVFGKIMCNEYYLYRALYLSIMNITCIVTNIICTSSICTVHNIKCQ